MRKEGAESSQSTTERADILLISSEEARRCSLESALGGLGDLKVADSIKSGLSTLSRLDIDLVVLDLPVADADDFGAVEDLAVAVPGRLVVALVAADEIQAGRLSRRGADAVISPEVSAEELQTVVTALISGRDFKRERVAQVENLFRILSAVEGSVLVHSPSGRMIALNDAAREKLVMPIEEVLFELPTIRPVRMVDHEGNALSIEDFPIYRAARTGKPASANQQAVNPDTGLARWFEGVATPLFRPSEDEPYAIVQTIRDVTAEREAEEALALAHRREHVLLEHAAEGYIVINELGIVTDASPALMAQYALELFGSERSPGLLLEEDLEFARRTFAQLLEDGPGAPTVQVEVRMFDRDGVEHWIAASLSNRLDEPSVQGVVVNVRDVTHRHQTLESMARLSAIVAYSDDAIYTTDANGVVLTWNGASERLFGYSAQEAIGAPLVELTAPRGEEDSFAANRAAMRDGKSRDLLDRPRRRKDGSIVTVSVKTSPILDEAGRMVATSSIARDVTERRRLEEAQRQAEERFRLGFERAPIGMAILDTSLSVLRVNQALCQMFGVQEEDLLGHSAVEFVHPEEAHDLAELLQMLAAGDIESYRGDRRFVHRDRSSVWTSLQVTLIPGEGDSPYLFSQIQDISDRKRSEDALALLALHDPLTSLPNRALLSERLAQALDRARTRNKLVTVLFLDVDRFKLINDGLGHVAGDQLLQDLARRLEQFVRVTDTVARFGGDEFIVVIDDVKDEEEARSLGQRILTLFDEPFVVEGQQLFVSASCGVVVVRPGPTVVEVLRDADVAMYRAKALGGARVELFDDALRAEVAQRYDIERDLAFALERGEIAVAYQPILSMTTDELVGVEALARWNSRQWGPLLPGQFIGAAEETGLVVPIGDHILREALAHVMEWRKAIPRADKLWVSVNVSARSLAIGEQSTRCAQALSDLGAPSDALRLELTESTVMRDVEAAIGELTKLRELGVAIAIDDFGTGQSSLSYLSRIPVDMLKVDQSLVAAPQSRAADAAIVQAVASLSGALGLDLCAEGVESEDQRVALTNLGCHLGQGYLFAPPMAPELFLKWVLRRTNTMDPARAD